MPQIKLIFNYNSCEDRHIKMLVRKHIRSLSLFCIRHLKVQSRSLTNKQTYSYLSPIDKPIFSLSLTSFHELSAQILQYLTVQHMICSQVSVIVGALAFRIGIEVIGEIIRGFKFDNLKEKQRMKDIVQARVSGEQNRLTLRWIDKIFVLDMVRDLQFYGVVREDINKAAWNYFRPSVLTANLALTYLNLNFLRGAYLLAQSTEYQSFCDSTLFVPSLAVHDPKFITPILVIFVNFYLLKRSRHPLLIHTNHPNNIFYCFNLAFISGLLFVPVPTIFHFAYLGLALGHIGIRGTRYFCQDIVRYLRRLIKK